jgi:hypothetical protein
MVGSKAEILEEYSTSDVYLRWLSQNISPLGDVPDELDDTHALVLGDEEHDFLNSSHLLQFYNNPESLTDSSYKILRCLPTIPPLSPSDSEEKHQIAQRWGILLRERLSFKERPVQDISASQFLWGTIIFIFVVTLNMSITGRLSFLLFLLWWWDMANGPLVPLNTAIGHLGFFFKPHHLPEGVTRLEWTCKCGHRSYDNYSMDTQAVRMLAAKMLRSGAVTRAETINVAAWKLTNMLNSVRNGIITLWNQVRVEKDQGRTAGATGSTDQAEPPTPPVGTGASLYLGLCFQGKAFTPWLSHLKIAWMNVPGVVVNSDQELFRQLRKKREQEEGKLSFKLSGVKFVKVSSFAISTCLYPYHLERLRAKSRISTQFILRPAGAVDNVEEDEFPPKENTNYLYRVPWWRDGKPAFPGSNWMAHLYHDPSAAANSTICLEAFPKKKDEPHTWKRPVYPEGTEPLHESAADENVCWGVYLKSEPRNTWALAVKALAQLITTIVIGVLALVETKHKPALAIIGVVSGIVTATADWVEEWVVRKRVKAKAD